MKLRIEIFNGNPFFCLVPDDHKNSADSNWRIEKGIRKYIQLTPEQSSLSLDVLGEMYKAGKFDTVPRMDNSDKIKSLMNTILISKDEAEVEAAKRLYRKYAGKEFAL